MNLDKLRPVMGNHAIRELLSVRSKSVRQAWLVGNWSSNQDLREIQKILTDKKIPIEIKNPALLEKYGRSHQGALLFADTLPEFDLNKLKDQKISKVLVLDGIEDPHNLGAVLRTAWLLGVQALLVPQDRAVGLTATVHKIACGGAEHVPVLTYANFSQPLEQLKEMDFWVFGLSHKASTSLTKWKCPEKVVWCVGAEDKGLRTTTEKLCDDLVSIPQLSASASYNASVAVAIALSESFRQQQSLETR